MGVNWCFMTEHTLASVQVQKQYGTEFWFDKGCFSHFMPACFSASWWREHGQILGQSRGRGITWFVQEAGKSPLVLRHYWRGGLIGRVLADRFIFPGVARSRAMAEFTLLMKLRKLGLPVPRPAAACCRRSGIFYRADLLIELIPEARDLVSLLRERALSSQEWQRIGALIHRLHQSGVYHSDLNGHNLMLDAAGKVWVIDFDKCGFRSSGRWQQEMLERLRRSLRKESGLVSHFYWQETDWDHLLQGYKHGCA